MRMWMVEPKLMCNRHLLGEHVETHMFVGTINKKVKLNGYKEHNCVEISSLKQRHEDLKAEMLARGFKHDSPLKEFNPDYLSDDILNYKIDKIDNYNNLMNRCVECRKRTEVL
jgi:hypothetical protein